MEHKKSSSLSKLLASQPVQKMIAHLLVSVSIFSFLFSYYSLSSSSPLYSRKLNYFSANSFQLPTHSMNKNYIFLICNGLLVFLAKTSGLVRCCSSSSSSSGSFDLINDVLQKKIGDGLLTYYNISLETKEPSLNNKEVFEPREVEKRVIAEEGSDEILNEEPKEVSIFIAESDKEQGAAAGSSDLFEHIDDEEVEKEVVFPPVAQGEEEKEEEEEEEEGEEEEEEEFTFPAQEEDEDDHAELLSTEELNQKFEEFIRKMKKEIMINEARQLVIVK